MVYLQAAANCAFARCGAPKYGSIDPLNWVELIRIPHCVCGFRKPLRQRTTRTHLRDAMPTRCHALPRAAANDPKPVPRPTRVSCALTPHRPGADRRVGLIVGCQHVRVLRLHPGTHSTAVHLVLNLWNCAEASAPISTHMGTCMGTRIVCASRVLHRTTYTHTRVLVAD